MHENGTVLVLKPRGGTTRDSQEESKVMVIMAFLAYISISAMIFALIMPLPFLDSVRVCGSGEGCNPFATRLLTLSAHPIRPARCTLWSRVWPLLGWETLFPKI